MHEINLIRKIREIKGWSQQVAGEKIGIGQHRVSLIENGLNPREAEKEQIVKAFEREGIPLLIPRLKVTRTDA